MKDTQQKDALELADVDYGSSGAFTINAWFRHDQENFENWETGNPPMEQFFGHGDPAKSMPTTNQLHLVGVRHSLRRVAVPKELLSIEVFEVLLVVPEPHVDRERAARAVVHVGELEHVLLLSVLRAARDHLAKVLVLTP